MRRSVSVLLLLAACAGEPPEETGEQRAGPPVPDHVAVLEAEEPQQPLVMPEYPEPVPGHLVTRAAGAEGITAEWPARAGSCERSRTLQLVGEQEGTGAILLFFLPPEGDSASSFPVVPADTLVPDRPAVRVGVQLLGETRGEVFQAIGGTVELAPLGGAVSGRFAITLHNIEANDTALFAGTFNEVRVRPLPPVECPALVEREPADTVADSTAAESLD